MNNNAFRDINGYRAFCSSTNEAIDYVINKTKEIDSIDIDNEEHDAFTYYKYLNIHIKHLDAINSELIPMINENINVSIDMCTHMLPTFVPIMQYIQETNNAISITISDIITRLYYTNPSEDKYYDGMVIIYTTTHSFNHMLYTHLTNVRDSNDSLYTLYKINMLKDLKKG
jgi:hypothetical protein